MRFTPSLVTCLFLFISFVSRAYTPPPLPVINTGNLFIATNATYGAVADGITTNTTAIQNAINAANAASGGGTVELPGPGTYLCGPLTLKTKVNLQIDTGATLMMLPMSAWPNAGTPFINGSSSTDLEISGGGTIDGQGAAWWGPPTASSRPNFLNFSGCNRLLIQNIRLQNPPTFHIMIKGNNANITIQGINIDTDPTSPNTDGMDIGSTNILIANSHINDGDDNIELGGSSALAAYIMITNCMFGHGHGVSVGSDLQAGVHDVTMVNCIFTNGDNAVRFKSDNNRGGVIANINYFNLSMTNIKYAPVLIYSYYNSYGNPTTAGITPAAAEALGSASVTATMPAWRNITISNVTATAAEPGMIWSRTEYPATNIVLSHINITSTDSSSGNGSFALYNVIGAQISDCTVNVAGSRKNFEIFNSQINFSNSVPGSTISLDGTGVTNGLAFYNINASLSDPAFFNASPVSIGAGTVSDTTSLTLPGTTPVNFTLGTTPATLAVTGNLALNSLLNITNGPGFVPGVYQLFTYTGTFSGALTLATLPAGYSGTLNTATNGQVVVVITTTNAQPPAAPTNLVATAGNSLVSLSWYPSFTATNYDLKRSLTNGGTYAVISSTAATNYTDAQVTNGTTYYYVVSAVNTNGEGANSVQAAATPSGPQPPAAPTNLVANAGNSVVSLYWHPSLSATNYNLKRSLTNGGNYAVITSTTGTNYTDTQVTNGTTYYYVVSAVNANGESTNSAQAGATPGAPAGGLTTTNIFYDTFSSSTLGSLSSVPPTPVSTGYQLLSSKSMSPAPGIGPGHLKFGLPTTSSSVIEMEALFTANPVVLSTNGCAVTLIVTFTNTSGLLDQSGSIGLGLFHGGGNYPVPGGLSNTLSGSITTYATGYAQTWSGYWSQLGYTGTTSQTLNRSAQTGADNNNQDTVTTGSSASYSNPSGATLGTASTTPSVTLFPGNPYTAMFNITLVTNNTLAITNTLFNGTSTNGTVVTQFGGTATGSSFLTNSFDALAFGWRVQSSTYASAIDINSITVNATLPAPAQTISLTPITLLPLVSSNQIQLSWPSDHLGWRLQIQTNDLSTGLSTNWITVPNSTNVLTATIPITDANGSVFLRLVYP